MSNIRVNAITDEAGTGAPDFPNGYTVAGAVPAGGFSYAAVSGATQALDVGAHNFFDAGTLTADTTISFTNVPTEAQWTYTAKAAPTTTYDLTAGSYRRNFNVYLWSTSPKDVFFKPDGTGFYVLNGGNNLFEFSLGKAWDITTALYLRYFSVSSQVGTTAGLAFKSDGTKLYVLDFFGSVFQYSLSTAWDISTASYDSVSFSVAAQYSNMNALEFSADGTKMYVSGSNSTIYQYTLSTAWALNTASYSSISKSVSAEETGVQGIFFKPDGTKMYVIGSTGDDVNQYTLSTAWNVSTASFDSITFYTGIQDSNPQGIFISPEGEKLYVLGGALRFISEYSIAAVTTLTTPASVQNPPSEVYYAGSQVAYTFVTANAGTTVKLINEQVV